MKLNSILFAQSLTVKSTVYADNSCSTTPLERIVNNCSAKLAAWKKRGFAKLENRKKIIKKFGRSIVVFLTIEEKTSCNGELIFFWQNYKNRYRFRILFEILAILYLVFNSLLQIESRISTIMM